MSTIVPYALPQRWALAVHSHPQNVDGIVYMSRHVNNQEAVVIFDRAAAKINGVQYQPLAKAAGNRKAITDLNIDFPF